MAVKGAVLGDILGSQFEFDRPKDLDWEHVELIGSKPASFTDDSVMMLAIKKALMEGADLIDTMVEIGRHYPNCGYGGRFYDWIMSNDHRPYNSWGNGSAMRASYAGWVAKSLEEAEVLAEISAEITHSHPDGINGAKAVAGSVFLLKKGGKKDDVKKYVSKYYKLDFTLDEIREKYSFDVSCKGSVPQAVTAFLEGKNFADVISNAISIGGDSDTIAAIAGSIAEVIYPMSQELRGRVVDKLDSFLISTIANADDFVFFRFADL